MPRLTASRALRAKLPESGYRYEWCSEIAGFGARLTANGARSWIVAARWRFNGGRWAPITLGRVGTLPCEGPPDAPGAADLAKIALNAHRRGDDPRQAIGQAKRPNGATLGELWAAYGSAGYPLLNAIGTKRASSVEVDTWRWGKHFTRIQHEAAADFDTARTQRWLDSIAGLGARSHALIMLKSLIRFGASRGLCEPHKITLTARPSRRVQNFLKPAELKRLDAVLVELSEQQPERLFGFAAVRLLLHTGMRKSEVLSLDWSAVDLDARVIHLATDKSSGAGRDVMLTDAAVDVLRSLPRMARGGFVFPGRRHAGHLADIRDHFHAALAIANLKRIRLHDLRHSFASAAIGSGTSLFTTGKLLGHRDARTTSRYAHLSAEAQREALDRMADALS